MLGLIAERMPRYGPKDKGSIPEKLLARLWAQRAARQESFRSASGSRIRVIYPGREGTAAGPDFRDAILEFEGQGLVRGDVELHVRQKDWHSHGHSSDPNYNGVVLHAALEVDSATTELQSGRDTPVVSLQPLLTRVDRPTTGPAWQAPEHSEDTPRGYAPVGMGLWELLEVKGYFRPETACQAGALLDLAGDQRFYFKSRRFRLFLEDQVSLDSGANGPDQTRVDQTLYEALMEGLGYKNNQQPFLKLAQRAPWRVLVEMSEDLPSQDRAAAVQGWLSAVSGLAPGTGYIGSPHGAALPRGLGSCLSRSEWHLSGLRPANHPLRRMAGAACWVDRHSQAGLVASLDQSVRQATQTGSPKALTACLAVAGQGARVAAVGRDRARDLAVNVALPFLHAATGDDSVYLEVYHQVGKSQENELTREMARLLLDPSWGRLVTSARRQQGLIHLHRVLTG